MGTELVSTRKIVRLCNSLQLEQDIVYCKAEILIDNFHNIVWADTEIVSRRNITKNAALQKDPELALVYLADFNPSENKRDIFKKMFLLFEAQWLKEWVETALEYVRAFSEDGDLYCGILDGELTQTQISAQDRQKANCAGKSSFYRKRTEAILLFGVAIWGVIVPYWLDLYHLSECRVNKLKVSESYDPNSN